MADRFDEKEIPDTKLKKLGPALLVICALGAVSAAITATALGCESFAVSPIRPAS